MGVNEGADHAGWHLQLLLDTLGKSRFAGPHIHFEHALF
jgi:hypothetical protein